MLAWAFLRHAGYLPQSKNMPIADSWWYWIDSRGECKCLWLFLFFLCSGPVQGVPHPFSLEWLGCTPGDTCYPDLLAVNGSTWWMDGWINNMNMNSAWGRACHASCILIGFNGSTDHSECGYIDIVCHCCSCYSAVLTPPSIWIGTIFTTVFL